MSNIMDDMENLTQMNLLNLNITVTMLYNEISKFHFCNDRTSTPIPYTSSVRYTQAQGKTVTFNAPKTVSQPYAQSQFPE
jgi:hypothetical protein